MKAENKMLALWLLPVDPERRFSSIIKQLARRFDAPVFEPHLTLYGTPQLPSTELAALNQLSLPKFIELEATGIELSEKFTKTLFVQFKITSELLELRDEVARALNGSKEELNPHLSLIYQKLPYETKTELARTMQLPFERVRFDALKAIVTPSEIESREGVASWRTVWERSFA